MRKYDRLPNLSSNSWNKWMFQASQSRNERVLVTNMNSIRKPGLAVVIMGVSGAGKSRIGNLLAETLPCTFLDADDFHTAENIEKMRNGIPLTDEDRWPWLKKLSHVLRETVMQGENVVLACSALRPQYRSILQSVDPYFVPNKDAQSLRRNWECYQKETNVNSDLEERDVMPNMGPLPRVVFVYLKATSELLAARLSARHREGKHYMSPTLLKSQLDALEIDEDAEPIICIDASLQPETIAKSIKQELGLQNMF